MCTKSEQTRVLKGGLTLQKYYLHSYMHTVRTAEYIVICKSKARQLVDN